MDDSGRFGINKKELASLHDPKSLSNVYGYEQTGLFTLLKSSPEGIDGDFESRTDAFNSNRLPTKSSKSFFFLCYQALQDKVLILLSVAAIISLALGLYETFGQGPVYDDEGLELPKIYWVEGVAILVAVVIVVIVGAANDYQKERQFSKLNKKKEDRELVVIRGSEKKMISIYNLLVGDVIILQTGDVVPADSILFDGELEADESALTGESDTLMKYPLKLAMDNFKSHLVGGKGAVSDPVGDSGVIPVDKGLVSPVRSIISPRSSLEISKSKLKKPFSLSKHGTKHSFSISRAGTKQSLSIPRSFSYDLSVPEHEILSQTDPFLISGSKILAGLGKAVVTAVGPNSIHGRTMMGLATESETTPLQERLDNLAGGISKYGFLAALLLFVILFIRFCINISPGGHLNDETSAIKGKDFLDILIVAITIVVVAVPEGLPLAVTLALAFATTRMAQNGNLVRVLKSCETMGGATAVCSDKTGTLTENRMTVVKGSIGLNIDKLHIEFDDLHSSTLEIKSIDMVNKVPANSLSLISTNIILNSTAFENGDYDEEKAKQKRIKPVKKPLLLQLFTKKLAPLELGNVLDPYLGNKTESALLQFAKDKLSSFDGKSLADQRANFQSLIVQVIPFESSRKWAGLVLKTDNGFRLFVKGAAEIIFKDCGFQYDSAGNVVDLDRSLRDQNLHKIDEYASEALRTIALAHRDFEGSSWPPSEYRDKNSESADPDLLVDVNSNASQDKRLILDLLVGIQDPLKEGVAEAVLQCKRAGVSVRMVTGDNLITAKAISKACNILSPEDLSNEYSTMEGPAFRALSLSERRRVVPQIKVLARSSPEDKRILVDTLRKSGEVVAVTGDGTNDAPALRLADVGFSMGISGTEVAREASDIILMTDDFSDIVQAIKWGRTVAVSIKKFIQFQLTVNITACILTFVSAVASSDGVSVLTAVQLLWVNLIMDTLAALALATDKPDDSFLNKKPAGRTAPLISTSMWKMIIGQSIVQLIITFVLHFAGARFFYGSGYDMNNREEKQLAAMTFNTFVWLQFWKLVVTRKLDECDEVTTVRGRINSENLNFFSHLFRNWYFISIALLIAGCQVMIMFVGGAAFSIARQTPAQWAVAIIGGFISIPAGLVIRIIPNVWVEAIFPTKAFNTFLYYVGFSWLRRKTKTDEETEDCDDLEESKTTYVEK